MGNYDELKRKYDELLERYEALKQAYEALENVNALMITDAPTKRTNTPNENRIAAKDGSINGYVDYESEANNFNIFE